MIIYWSEGRLFAFLDTSDAVAVRVGVLYILHAETVHGQLNLDGGDFASLGGRGSPVVIHQRHVAIAVDAAHVAAARQAGEARGVGAATVSPEGAVGAESVRTVSGKTVILCLRRQVPTGRTDTLYVAVAVGVATVDGRIPRVEVSVVIQVGSLVVIVRRCLVGHHIRNFRTTGDLIMLRSQVGLRPALASDTHALVDVAVGIRCVRTLRILNRHSLCAGSHGVTTIIYQHPGDGVRAYWQRVLVSQVVGDGVGTRSHTSAYRRLALDCVLGLALTVVEGDVLSCRTGEVGEVGHGQRTVVVGDRVLVGHILFTLDNDSATDGVLGRAHAELATTLSDGCDLIAFGEAVHSCDGVNIASQRRAVIDLLCISSGDLERTQGDVEFKVVGHAVVLDAVDGVEGRIQQYRTVHRSKAQGHAARCVGVGVLTHLVARRRAHGAGSLTGVQGIASHQTGHGHRSVVVVDHKRSAVVDLGSDNVDLSFLLRDRLREAVGHVVVADVIAGLERRRDGHAVGSGRSRGARVGVGTGIRGAGRHLTGGQRSIALQTFNGHRGIVIVGH